MVDKIFLFLLFLAIFVVIKDVLGFVEGRIEDETLGIFKYITNLSKTRLLTLGISLSYIFTIIFTGFNV